MDKEDLILSEVTSDSSDNDYNFGYERMNALLSAETELDKTDNVTDAGTEYNADAMVRVENNRWILSEETVPIFPNWSNSI